MSPSPIGCRKAQQLQAGGYAPAWFTPDLGLGTVRALLGRLGRPGDHGSLPVDWAVAELRYRERLPALAADGGARFRLYVAD